MGLQPNQALGIQAHAHVRQEVCVQRVREQVRRQSRPGQTPEQEEIVHTRYFQAFVSLKRPAVITLVFPPRHNSYLMPFSVQD